MLPTLSWLEQQYIKGGAPEQKYALVSVFGRAVDMHPRSSSVRATPGRSLPFGRQQQQRQQQQKRLRRSSKASLSRQASGSPKLLVVANVHLDAAGDNTHRTNQLSAVGAAVASELAHPLHNTNSSSRSSTNSSVKDNGSTRRISGYSSKRSSWSSPTADVWPSAMAVVCGDFNCFRLKRSDADNDLANMVAALAPLAAAPAAAEASLSSLSSQSPDGSSSGTVVEATAAFSAQHSGSSAASHRVGQFVDAHFKGAGSSSVGMGASAAAVVPEDTHWFARSNEDGLGHRIAATLGNYEAHFGLDKKDNLKLARCIRLPLLLVDLCLPCKALLTTASRSI